MKRITISHILLLILAYAVPAFGMERDSSLRVRNINQQRFASKYITEFEPKEGFSDATQFLNFMLDMEKAWAISEPNQSDIYRSINTYVPIYAMRNLFKKDLPEGSECLVYNKIALPAFLQDIEFLEESLSRNIADITEAAYLIRIANFDWASSQWPTFQCINDDKLWASLKSAVSRYPSIIERYYDQLMKIEGTEPAFLKSLRGLMLYSGKISSYLILLDKIYEKQYPELFLDLAAQFPGASDLYVYVHIGRRLVKSFKDEEDNLGAFAVLDLMASNTSNSSLSRNELRLLYESIDANEGPARFERLIKGNSNSLSRSDQSQLLEGVIFDAQLNEAINLDSLHYSFLVLDFWSMACGPCIKEIPKLNYLHQKFGDQVGIISVNSDLLHGAEVSTIIAFVKDHDIQYPVLLDTEESNLMKKFEVAGWPTRFLIDKDNYLFKQPLEDRTRLTLSEIESHIGNLLN